MVFDPKATKLWRERNAEEWRDYRRSYQKNPEVKARRAVRDKARRLEQKEKLAGRSMSRDCEICHEDRKLVFDHCHATEKFRGWVCHRCNLVMGNVENNPELLRNMAEYLCR